LVPFGSINNNNHKNINQIFVSTKMTDQHGTMVRI